MKRYPWKWEELDEKTWRAKVIGGWLVSIQPFTPSTNKSIPSVSATFIADRDHEWCITPLVVEQKPLTKSVAKDFAIPAK